MAVPTDELLILLAPDLLAGSQRNHAVHNGGKVPVHYYLIEYKRIDGDGFAQNWKKWYPWMQYMQYMC